MSSSLELGECSCLLIMEELHGLIYLQIWVCITQVRQIAITFPMTLVIFWVHLPFMEQLIQEASRWSQSTGGEINGGVVGVGLIALKRGSINHQVPP